MNFKRRPTAALAVMAALSASLATAPALAEVIVLGSDYFMTIQPTFFTPLGALNPLVGLAIGPGTTDTIVQRRSDCSLNLFSPGSTCTIPIELVALSLVSTVDPNVRLRESPTIASTGSMTMASDGTGNGGTFASFFDVFVELSLDNGATWTPGGDLILSSAGTGWLAGDPVSPGVVVDGLVGDQAANRHTNKAAGEFDFRLAGSVTEQHAGGLGVHSAVGAVVAEPGGLALSALALLAAFAPGFTSRCRSSRR